MPFYMRLLLNTSSCAQRTVRPNKLKHRSVEQRKVYCRAEKGEQVASAQKKPKHPNGFWGRSFIGKIWGGGCRVCDFLPFWLVVR